MVKRIIAAIIIPIIVVYIFLFVLDGEQKRLLYDFNEDSIPNLKGQVALVTGGCSGIGYHTSQQLVNHGANVIVTATKFDDAMKCAQRLESIASKFDSKGKAFGFHLDLKSKASIYELEKDIRRMTKKLNIVILNAGMQADSYEIVKDYGVESQLGANWIGHFLLQQILMPIIEDSAPARIVILSSDAQALPILSAEELKKDFVQDNEENRKNYGRFRNYAISKLGNLLHALELHEQYKDKGIIAVAVHPGYIMTQMSQTLHIYVSQLVTSDPTIQKKISALSSWLMSLVSMKPETGALTTLFAATSPKVTQGGVFITPIGEIHHVESSLFKISRFARDPNMRKHFWNLAAKYADA